MRKWGIVVSATYLVMLAGLLFPAFVFLAGDDNLFSAEFVKAVREVAGSAWVWVIVLALCAFEAILLFVSVDTSQKRLRPRTHVALTCFVTATLIALLTVAAILSIAVAAKSKALDGLFDPLAKLFVFVFLIWFAWGALFSAYLRDSSAPVTKAVAWLLRGSVLELLIVVPCHVIVRRRNECSAPIATSFGICSGIAIMLLSFGPGILFLFKKRLDAYSQRQPSAQPLQPGA